MRINKFYATILLALLAAGCSKDKADRINLFARNMLGNSKIWIDPANVNGATWVAGETINLNGNTYNIIANSNGSFSIAVPPLQNDDMYAVYPGTTATDGNIIEVTNSNSSGATITMKQLAVRFLSTGGHQTIFPMASQATKNSESLYFDHLTAGLHLTLTNSSNNGIEIDHIKIVVQGTGAAGYVTPDDSYENKVYYTVKWELQGPTLPSGNVGGIEGDREVKFSSEMHFKMQHEGEAGATVAGVTVPAKDGNVNGSISFCVPATVSSMRRLSITGYDANGTQLFTKAKDLNTTQSLEVNNMYYIPSFNIN